MALLQHDLKYMEFRRAEGDEDPATIFWCICGEFRGEVPHLRLRPIYEDLLRPLDAVGKHRTYLEGRIEQSRKYNRDGRDLEIALANFAV